MDLVFLTMVVGIFVSATIIIYCVAISFTGPSKPNHKITPRK
jgi:hypothetical protein